MKVAAEALLAITVFRDLDIDRRRRLAESMWMEIFAPNQLVIAQDEDSTDLFFVISGHVRSTLFSTNGKEVSFQDLGVGEMFGELAAIDGGARSTHVVALAETRIARLPNTVFWEAMRAHPEVMKHTLLRLTGLVRMHLERIFEYSTLGVKNRIHAELLRLAREVSDDDGEIVIPAPPTHAEIASRVATHREAVTRECKHLEHQGIIEWRPGRHVVKDVPALERMVKEVRGH